jgi:hypothetical protein
MGFGLKALFSAKLDSRLETLFQFKPEFSDPFAPDSQKIS